MPTITFDMDGTIADLYGVEDWEARLNAHDATPYTEAQPLVNMERLTELCGQLQSKGFTIAVVSWLAMHSNKEYDKAVRKAKKDWLKKYFPVVDELHLVKYGTRKKGCLKNKVNAILIDDNADVRKQWNGLAIDQDFMPTLEILAAVA